MRLLVVGKIKDQNLKNLCEDYIKRINRFSKIEVIEIKDIGKEKEAEKILNLSEGYDLIVCDEKGKEMSSKEFSDLLKKKELGRLCFVIGGPEGLRDDLKKESFALSKMTYTHEMARMILLEQIYRGFSIIKNLPYHKI